MCVAFRKMLYLYQNSYKCVAKSCSFHSLPKERIPIYNPDIVESYEDGIFLVSIQNPIDCPLLHG